MLLCVLCTMRALSSPALRMSLVHATPRLGPISRPSLLMNDQTWTSTLTQTNNMLPHSGAFGRLGHGKVQDEAQPRTVTALANQRIVWTACGWDTTAAVNGANRPFVLTVTED